MKPENYIKIMEMMQEIDSLQRRLTEYEKLDFNGNVYGPKLIDYVTPEERVDLNRRLRKDLQKKIDQLKKDLLPL